MAGSLSIITINYNNASGLSATIKSINNQTVSPFELIVIDGGSKDESISIIEENLDKITYWISEPDKGIYNAHNKGIKKATGDFLLFLNSGDILHNEFVLENSSRFLDADIVYGDLQIVEASKSWVKKYNGTIRFGYFLSDTLPHQGAFIKRAIFDKTGVYDESMRFAADWKFFLNAICLHGVSIRYLDFIISDYDYSGISSNPKNQGEMLLEKRRVLESDYPRFIDDYDELTDLRSRYPLLANSRIVKSYFKIRKLFIKSSLDL